MLITGPLKQSLCHESGHLLNIVLVKTLRQPICQNPSPAQQPRLKEGMSPDQSANS